jgi:hypothetical protein
MNTEYQSLVIAATIAAGAMGTYLIALTIEAFAESATIIASIL